MGMTSASFEEGGLQDGVGALAHADLDSLIDSVDGVQLNVVVGNVLLVGSVQVLISSASVHWQLIMKTPPGLTSWTIFMPMWM